MKPWSASSGRVEEDERQPRRERGDGGDDSGTRPFEYISPRAGSRRPLRREARTPHRKGPAARASGRDPPVPGPGAERLGGLGAGDQHRHEQRQQQQRHDQLARARLGGQRRHQRAHRGHAHVRPAAGSPAARAACRPGPGPAAAGPKAGTATSSTAARKRNSALALARNSAVRSTGASSSASMPPCSRSAANRRVTPITAASSSVTQSTPRPARRRASRDPARSGTARRPSA